MEPKQLKEPMSPTQASLAERGKALHGKRRELHDDLAHICERFKSEPLTREHRKESLVDELRYLLDFYEDEVNWEGVK